MIFILNLILILTRGRRCRFSQAPAGEKMQILSGTIARVDRNVPEVDSMYEDEKTFYALAEAPAGLWC